MRKSSFLVVFVALADLVAGCRRHPPPSKDAPAVASAIPTPPPPLARIERDWTARESGGLVLGRINDRRHAFIADEDDAAIVEVDLEKNEVVRSTPVASRPRDLILLADGRIVATLPDANAVAIYGREETGGLRELKKVTTPVEPIAMGLSPDDAELFVSTGESHTLVRFAVDGLTERGRWDLGREPRAVLVSNDGKRVFVSHAADTVVSVVPLGGEAEVDRRDIGHGKVCLTQIDSGECVPRRYARNAQALVRIGERGIIVPAAQALPNPPTPSFPSDLGIDSGGITGYGVGGSSGEPIFMDVATLDANDGSLVKVGDLRSGTNCLQPRAAVAVNDRVLVACFGSARIEQLDNPHGRSSAATLQMSSSVPAGPTAIAVERGGESVVVWSMFARQLSRLGTRVDRPAFAGKQAIEKVPRARPSTLAGLARAASTTIDVGRAVARDKTWLAGRELFFSNSDSRISGDSRACASCHVDGRDDGLTWQTPMGPRRTRLLAGQLAAGPYGWRGEHPTLEAHVKVTFRQLRGTGLPADELASLLTYVRSLPKPPALVAPHDVSQGEKLFASAECTGCHNTGASDRSVHDVGTGGSFMTPTLVGIATKKQLMHDGRYANLDELIAGAKSMGRGSSLSPDERRALVGYLETL